MSLQPLFERYRPRTWADVIGQPKAIREIHCAAKTAGSYAQSWWLTGISGAGKTTLAYLVAREHCDDVCIDERDATGMTVGDVKQIESEWLAYGWGKGGRSYIVNEAHGLRRDVVRAWLTALERRPAHVSVIFTTTREGEYRLFDDQDDAGPLVSRCTRIALTSQGLAKAFAARARDIAQAEGLDGLPLARYVRLAQDCHNNMRRMLSEIGKGAMLAP